jgi:MerR family transcriptional regulator, repressor of the yfmOP operon
MSRSSPKLTPISVLAARLGVTPRNLRYYEELGLARSDRISPKARGYDGHNGDRLTLIVALRAVGVPTATIRRALDPGRGANSRSAAAAATLRQTLCGKRTLIEAIERLLDGQTLVEGGMDETLRGILQDSVAASPPTLRDTLAY